MNDFDTIWRERWRPPDRSPPWRWCENHIGAIPYSPIPGRFRSENSPHIREPMEAVVDPRIKTVSIIAAVQASKTTVAELTLCYIIANLPGPILYLDQTDEDARDQAESRLHRIFEECGPVKALFPADRHRKKTTTVHFANSASLWVRGGHNKTNLQRRSIRWLFFDETWRTLPGHMAEAEARVTAFGWLGKCVFLSQGGEDDDDTHRKFETTDMREWTFACPQCDFRQAYQWERVEWGKDCKDDNGQYDFERVRATTVLQCGKCGHRIADTDENRRRLNATGAYVPQNPNAAKENAGFHWNALATMSWGNLAELYLRAKLTARKGDTSLLQQFYQKRLGLPWRESVEDYKLEIATSGYKMGELWEEEGGVDSRSRVVSASDILMWKKTAESNPQVKVNYSPLRFLTVDVQMDCFYLVVRSWSAEGSSRLVWCERVLTWEDIEAVQQRFNVHDALVFVDAGYNSYEVYRQCGRHQWTALMGDSRATFTHKLKGGKTIQRFYSTARRIFISKGLKCRAFFWSNLQIKDTLARLRGNQDPANGVTWEVPGDIPEEYLKQMEGEHRVKKGNKWVWEQIGKRPQHFWDAECMSVAAAYMLKIIGQESIQDQTEPESK